MNTIKWIAWRILKELLRDKRTIAFLTLVPLVVMTLIYFAVSEDEIVEIGVVTRGTARLFDADLITALEKEDDIRIVNLNIDDTENDRDTLVADIESLIKTRKADAIIYMDKQLLIDRFDNKPGVLHIYVEGSHPTITAGAFGAIADAMDDLASSLPVVIDESCSAMCANSVNSLPMEIEKHYLHGSEDYRQIDYFLPTFAPFFAFFFTFVLATISFQRERVNGTLERLLIAPIRFTTVISGYIFGFFIFATIQATIILTYVIMLISFSVSPMQLIGTAMVIVLMMLIALSLGLLASFVSRNEFQAVQFIPLVILPQIFLSDMIWDIRSFPYFFQLLSYPLPLTHANAAMRGLLIENLTIVEIWPQLLILSGFVAVIMLILSLVGKKHSFA